jgi:lysophospholipase L1-like esterase
MRILIFGDSITQGFWDLEYGGWVQRIRKEYDRQAVKNLTGSWPTVFNLGIAGDKTGDIVKRLPYEIEARRLPEESLVLIFAIGINDTSFIGEDKTTNLDNYREELGVLLASAKHYSDKVLFVGLSPVDEALCNPWIHDSTGICFKNERILEFESALRKFCIEKEVPCVQIIEKFQKQQAERELLSEGLHPNDAGHQLIAELVKPELDKLL